MRSLGKKSQSSRTVPRLRANGKLAAFAAVCAAGLAGLTWAVPAHAATAPGATLDGITAPARNDAWAVGNTAGNVTILAHWNGAKWSPESTRAASGLILSYAYSSSPGDLWMFGDSTKTGDPWAVVCNGKSWGRRALPFGTDPNEVAVLGLSDVWAGTSQCPVGGGSSNCAVLTHWSGAKPGNCPAAPG
jgi:hypothetical protein